MYDILQLNDMLIPELLDIAEQLKIPKYKKLDKQELIYRILDKQAELAENVPTKSKNKKKKLKLPKKASAAIDAIKAEILPLTNVNAQSSSIATKLSEEEVRTLKISIDPGTTPDEEIASLLADLSRIYRQMGGSGIEFKLDSVTLNKEELA